MRAPLCLLVLLAFTAGVSATTYFSDTLRTLDGWVNADRSDLGTFALAAPKVYADATEDLGLKTTQDAKFYDISKGFPDFTNKGKDLVVQFSVKHEQNIDCGGGYIKLMPAGLDQKDFKGDSVYGIMFGPDICGYTKKIHLIFNYNGKNLLWKKEPKAESDDATHLYTAIVHPDNTYEVQVDGKRVEGGKLSDDWDFMGPKKIKDPSQSKPSDWVDQREIPDPSDKKPEGHDDIPKQIVDPKATKPEGWNDADDGEWEPPMIDNPEFKGPWKAKMIPNPSYKGEWIHPEIDNPDYKEDDNLYLQKSLAFAGFDLWQVKSGTIFDNIILTDSIAEAQAFAKTTEKLQAVEKAHKEEADKKAKEAADKAAAEAAAKKADEKTPEAAKTEEKDL
jgi:calreticulin